MEKRILYYVRFIDHLLETLSADKAYDDLEDIKKEHLIQISFFQHERFIHLLVTVLFTLIEFMAIMMTVLGDNPATIILAMAILILLIPYIRHYFILENLTQKMYEQYDRMCAFAMSNAFTRAKGEEIYISTGGKKNNSEH